jgi:SH3-like domain-containing protein
MRLSHTMLALGFCAVLSGSMLASQDTQTPKSNAKPLTNGDVVDMVKAGLSQEIVIAKINASACEFDTSPTALKVLKTANIPEAVILAMVQAPAAVRKDAVSTEPTQFAIIRCNHTERVPVFLGTTTEPSSSHTVESFHVKCGDRITLLNPSDRQSWEKIRTAEGQVGYISSSLVSRDEPAGSKAAGTASRKGEKLQKANDDLEDCRVGFQNDYETRMGVLNTMALGPTVRLASASRLKQNLDAELRHCRSRYELRVKAIEGE